MNTGKQDPNIISEIFGKFSDKKLTPEQELGKRLLQITEEHKPNQSK